MVGFDTGSTALFRLDPTDFYRTVDILDAALIAKRYDIPIIFRLLDEAIQNAYNPFSHDLPLIFAIWAIAGVDWKTSSAAEAMVNNYDITNIPKDIVAALARHAPDAITQLQSLQLRYYSALARLLQACKMVQCCDCPEPECAGEGEQLESSFFAALQGRSVAEVKAADERNYGLSCHYCQVTVRETYRIPLEWYHRFATQYGFTEDYEEYERRILDR